MFILFTAFDSFDSYLQLLQLFTGDDNQCFGLQVKHYKALPMAESLSLVMTMDMTIRMVLGFSIVVIMVAKVIFQ